MNKKIIYFVLITVVFFSIFPSNVFADELGQRESFYVSPDFDSQARVRLSATLRFVSDRAYFYVEDDYWNSLTPRQQSTVMASIDSIANNFDLHIYPILTNFYGSIPNPGIDNDPKITFLLSDLINNIGGYFDSSNELTKEQSRYSNEREMIVINLADISNTSRTESFIGHELQHLISFKYKELDNQVVDDVWINEARSEYALTRLGYNEPFRGSYLEKRAIAFVQNPNDSLTEWKNLFADYGQITIFGEYIADAYSPEVLADTLETKEIGIQSLNFALSKNGYNDRFENVFGNWMVANILNDPTIDRRYGYERQGLTDLRVQPTFQVQGIDDNNISEYSYQYKDWEQRWYEINNLIISDESNSALSAEFTSPSLSSFRVAYIVFHNDGSIYVNNVRLYNQNSKILINDLGTEVYKIIIMPYKTDKISGFEYTEQTIPMTMLLSRVENTQPNISTDIRIPSVVPSTYGLREGDFIRAHGDPNIYIVNYAGYKRLILSPNICLQYGHLGERGCFDAVKMVTPEIRDAFVTSNVYTNGETKDGTLYLLNITGEDSAELIVLDKEKFFSDGNSLSSVFQFNNREQNSYN